LGVVGGLGPMATAIFMEMIINMTDAGCDQEHVKMIIYNMPTIPDRTKHILGLSKENPSTEIIKIGKRLVEDGACEIAIPCITASFYHDEIKKEIHVPVVNGIKEAGEYLCGRNVKKVGVMATDGTMQCRLFDRQLDKCSIQCVYPDDENQKKVMHLIYDNVKAGKPTEMDVFNEVTEHLKSKGVERILLGCTELSVIKRNNTVPPECLDVMEIMARKCVNDFGKLKKEWINL
ncbi:MAG: amino acid racemase, partial [Butyrivibrio sp.]|nr:amino acid racemase [Butyrivibrio sp.]